MYSVRLALRRAAPALMRLAWRVVARIWNRSDLADSSCVVCGISSPSLLYAYCTHAERQIRRTSILQGKPAIVHGSKILPRLLWRKHGPQLARIDYPRGNE